MIFKAGWPDRSECVRADGTWGKPPRVGWYWIWIGPYVIGWGWD